MSLALPPSTLPSPAIELARDKRRERERRSRERRVAKLDVMRHTLEVLEFATLVTGTVSDMDAVWDDFLDDRSVKLRSSLRLSREAEKLELERSQLQRLLEEHKLASRALQELVEPPKDGWELKLQEIRDAVRAHFQPWTQQECQARLAVSLKEIEAFKWSQNKQTTGVSFLGWHEMRRVDPERGQFQGQFSKKFKGHEIMDYVNVGWDTYTDPKTFGDVILGNRLQYSYEVMQQLGPNTVISRSAQRFPPHPTEVYTVHTCYLVSRVKTQRGFLMCIRSICCPELQKALDGPNDTWASNFMWFNWEMLPADEIGYEVQCGGSVGTKDIRYLNHWMFEGFGCLLRSERLATGRGLIKSE